MIIHQTLLGPMRVVVHSKPENLSTAEKQAAIRNAIGWPWRAIPSVYERWGAPCPAVMDGALKSLRKASPLLRVLTITGPVGVGKTTEACKLAAWMTCDRLTNWRKQGQWDDRSIGYYLCLRMGWVTPAQMEELTEYPILILDDLSGNLTLAGLEKAQQILEERIANRRPTIITSTIDCGRKELSGPERFLVGMCEREIAVNKRSPEDPGSELGLASRLAGGSVITLTGIDRRLALGDDAKAKASNDP